MVKLSRNIFESRLRNFKTLRGNIVPIQVLATVFMPGASFNCIFCKIRKQWISKSIQDMTKALVTIIFIIIFPYAIYSDELLTRQYCGDGERIVRVEAPGQWAVPCLLYICKRRLTAARGKAAPSKCLRPAHTDSQQLRNSEEDFSSGDWAERKWRWWGGI